MSMIVPPGALDTIPVRVRQLVYVTLAVAFVVLTAIHAAYASINVPDPRALTVAFAVYGVLTSAALTLATANSRPAAAPASSSVTSSTSLTSSSAKSAKRARRPRPRVRTPEDGADDQGDDDDAHP